MIWGELIHMDYSICQETWRFWKVNIIISIIAKVVIFTIWNLAYSRNNFQLINTLSFILLTKVNYQVFYSSWVHQSQYFSIHEVFLSSRRINGILVYISLISNIKLSSHKAMYDPGNVNICTWNLLMDIKWHNLVYSKLKSPILKKDIPDQTSLYNCFLSFGAPNQKCSLDDIYHKLLTHGFCQ